MIRVPKPSYLKSQLTRHEKPDATLYRVLTQLAELYQLGEIQTCHRAPLSTSLNFIVTTSQGRFVFRRHRLSEPQIAYEHQVLDYLQRHDFPAPCMLINQTGQPWSEIDGSLYGVYEFVEGYFPTNFLWWPAIRRDITVQCGRTLGEFHQAIAGLTPSIYRWNGYHPTEPKRWREGDWFRQALKDIRPLLQNSTATSPTDDFTRVSIDGLEKMLNFESVVETQTDLSKLVIHGDYAPWNVLFRSGSPPFVLDFNESRLDLQIYDVVLATFWFAWNGDHLNQDHMLAFQAGYNQTGQLKEIEISLASSVFQWIMARSLIERLHKHYLGRSPLAKGAAGMKKQYQMCIFAEQYPQQLVAGLKG